MQLREIDAAALGVADGYRAGIAAYLEAWRERERLQIREWAERYRRMPRKHASTPGTWSNDRFPYQVGIMDALEWTHPARIVAIMKSAQSGISDAVLNWIGRGLHTEGDSFLALWPTDDTAATWSKSRVAPMIEAIPDLAQAMVDRHKQGNSIQEKHFADAVLYIGSGGKANDVAQVSVPNVYFDDADRIPPSINGEGDPFELALMRSNTFPRRKAAVISTPTDDETSRIGKLWKRSTMGRFFMPCPHCGHFQFLVWSGVKWQAGKPEKAEYMCAECAAMIDERRHKTQMLAEGEWRHEYGDRMLDVCGFHVSGLMAPLGLGDSWGDHARVYERVKGSPEALRVFVNTREGLPYKGARKRVEWEVLKARAQPFPLRKVPEGVLVLTSGTDVQADRLEVQIVGWGEGGLVVPLDYRVFSGDPTRSEVWEEHDAFIAEEWPSARGVPMRLSCSMVDSNYLREHVLNYTRPRGNRNVFACYGSTNEEREPIGRPSYPDLKGRKGKIDERGAERYALGVSKLKHWLYEELRADGGEPIEGSEEVAPRAFDEQHIRFSTELGDEYFKQLVAETYDPKDGWIARANHHRNEALDTMIYARAAAMHHRVTVDRMKAAGWARLREIYEPAEDVKAAEGVVGKDPIRTRTGFFPTPAVTKN